MYSLNAALIKPSLFVIFFVVLLPILILSLAFLASTGSFNWKIQMVIVTMLFPVASLLILQVFIVKVAIKDNRLVVGGGLYKEVISLSEIRCDDIREMGVPQASALMGTRINGVGMPGFHLGWFRQHNGRKFFALMGSSPVALIPTVGEFDLLISVKSLDRFINDLCKNSD